MSYIHFHAEANSIEDLKRQLREALGKSEPTIQPQLLNMCSKTLKIPMRERCESLNAAAAATIVLWQMGG